MGKAVSSDLRLRIVRGIAAGKSRRGAAAQFEVSPSMAVRIQARYAATGSLEPAKQGRPKGSGKLAPYREALIEKVKAKPESPTRNSCVARQSSGEEHDRGGMEEGLG